MGPQNADNAVSGYMRSAGDVEDNGYRLALDELVWLVEHATGLNGQRLELLRSLQAELPRGDDQEGVAELKELLTDLIIMNSRLADRESRIGPLLRGLIDVHALERVSVGRDTVEEAIRQIVRASAHATSVAGDGP